MREAFSGARLPPHERPAERIDRVAVRGLQRHRLGEEVRLVDQRSHPRLQQVGADVEKEDEASDQKERDDQQAGHQPDEDTRG